MMFSTKIASVVNAACLLVDKQSTEQEENLYSQDLIESFAKTNELPGDENIVDRYC